MSNAVAAIDTLEPLHRIIAARITNGTRILDLGCGDGRLLQYLMEHKGCSGYGVEHHDASIQECLRRGVPVLQLNLDEGLRAFEPQSFDLVLQINTLQHLRNAQTMVQETARVGRAGMIAFPNFAHWRNRWQVLSGRMPVSKTLPYAWYDTPNIRVATFDDFLDLAYANELQIHDAFGVAQAHHDQARIVRHGANWRANTAVFHFSRPSALTNRHPAP